MPPGQTYPELDVSTLKQISDDHQHPDDPFVALADFKVILEKGRKQTRNELLRATPGTLGARPLIASTALRAHRNRHLGTLMHCCEAWEPVGKCFDQCSFGCTNFHGFSQIIVSLTRERNEVERECSPCAHTSCTEGTAPSEPLGKVEEKTWRMPLRSPNSFCYRLSPNHRAVNPKGVHTPWPTSEDRNSAISSGQRPPTSAVNTTRRALHLRQQPSDTCVLCVRWLVFGHPHRWWLHLACHSCPDNTSPYARMRTFFLVACHISNTSSNAHELAQDV